MQRRPYVRRRETKSVEPQENELTFSCPRHPPTPPLDRVTETGKEKRTKTQSTKPEFVVCFYFIKQGSDEPLIRGFRGLKDSTLLFCFG